MVVTANDSMLAVDGLSENGISDMPVDAFESMPEGDDEAVLSDLAEAEDVPTESDEAEADPTEAIRAELDAALRKEFDGKFRRDKANLQSALNKQLHSIRQEAMGAQSREQEMRNLLIAELREVGLDDNEIKRRVYAIEGQLSQAEKKMAQQAQQVEGGFQQSATGLIARHQELLKQNAFDESGNQLFDPSDPEIEQGFLRAAGLIKQHWDIHQGRDGSPYQMQAMVALQQVKELMWKKREAGVKARAALARQPAAKKQQAVRAQQKARGPQNTASGAGGGATALDDIEAAVRAEFQARGIDPNKHYNDVFNEMMRRKMAQGA